jgi:para-nitrobenzyl esterase
MTSPLARGLFHKAISESGSITRHPSALSELEAAGERWVRSVTPPAGDAPIAHLRRLAAREVLALASDAATAARPPGELAVDGWVLPRLPAQAFFAGQQAPMPMVVGHTSRELPRTMSDDEMRRNIESGTPPDLTARVLAAYGLAGGARGAAEDPILGPVSVQLIVDVQFRCTGVLQQAWVEATGHAAYGYQFDRAIPGRESEGALHSGELPYVFGSFPSMGNLAGSFGEIDRRLSDTIQRYWTNFARKGDPNGEGLPAWPRFGARHGYVEFMPDGRVVAGEGLRRPQCDLFRQAVEREPPYTSTSSAHGDGTRAYPGARK